jgi:hypothetical protein
MSRPRFTAPRWNQCDDPHAMIAALPKRTSVRKLRLLLAACAGRVRHLLPDAASRRALEVAERFADGEAGPEELQASARAADEAFRQASRHDGYAAREAMFKACAAARRCSATAVPNAWELRSVVNESVFASAWESASKVPAWELQTPHFTIAFHRASEAVCALVRDQFMPFNRPVIDPNWPRHNDGAVRRLALMIYQERRFEDLPILADALEDAGCTDAGLLAHCRGGGPHVRGCWVLDALLTRK